jgi:hypothetical protein
MFAKLAKGPGWNCSVATGPFSRQTPRPGGAQRRSLNLLQPTSHRRNPRGLKISTSHPLDCRLVPQNEAAVDIAPRPKSSSRGTGP